MLLNDNIPDRPYSLRLAARVSVGTVNATETIPL